MLSRRSLLLGFLSTLASCAAAIWLPRKGAQAARDRSKALAPARWRKFRVSAAGVTRYSYDTAEPFSSLTPRSTHVTTYQFDRLGRLIRQVRVG